jgi:hypothetical protein
MQLKVCECCGRLFVRTGPVAGVYCCGCAAVLAQFPPPRAKRATGRKKMVKWAMSEARPELALYRKYTEALLKRYMQLSLKSGGVPSRLGQPMFRGRVTSYKVSSFADVVIFVVDVERCLKQLSKQHISLLKLITLQQYTQGEASALVGISLRSVVRHYAAALDALTEVFLQQEILIVQ